MLHDGDEGGAILAARLYDVDKSLRFQLTKYSAIDSRNVP